MAESPFLSFSSFYFSYLEGEKSERMLGAVPGNIERSGELFETGVAG